MGNCYFSILLLLNKENLSLKYFKARYILKAIFRKIIDLISSMVQLHFWDVIKLLISNLN